jgi:hypothetical protein
MQFFIKTISNGIYIYTNRNRKYRINRKRISNVLLKIISQLPKVIDCYTKTGLTMCEAG